MTLANRIREAMGERTQADIARATKKTEGAVTQWLDGTTKSLRAETAALLEAATGYRAGWLATGRGPKLASESNVAAAPLGARRIPLLDYVQAGAWTEAMGYSIGAVEPEALLTDLELSEQAFALEIKGNSMQPDFSPGDRVIIDPAIQPSPGDFVVAKNGEHEATFKRFRKTANLAGEQVIELVPLNPDYPSLRSDVNPLVIIGTMVEHRRYRRTR